MQKLFFLILCSALFGAAVNPKSIRVIEEGIKTLLPGQEFVESMIPESYSTTNINVNTKKKIPALYVGKNKNGDITIMND